MRRLLFFFILTVGIMPAFSQQEKEVQAFLEGVYNKVADIRAGHDGDYESLMERHCSHKFLEYYSEIRRWEEKRFECILHSGAGAYDIFIGCNDYFDSVRYSVGNVQKTADEKIYRATVTAHFFCDAYKEKEWETERSLLVVHEKGEWHIADFQSPGKESDLEIMKKELPQAIKAHISSDEARIALRLERAYKEVVEIVNGKRFDTSHLNKKYLTKEFNELIDEVNYWENKLGDMIVDHDCWIRMQDWDNINFNISNIIITSPGTAVADVTHTTIIGTKEYTGKTLLHLLKENGEWYIDDFADYAGDSKTLHKSDSNEMKEGILEAVESFDGVIDFLEF